MNGFAQFTHFIESKRDLYESIKKCEGNLMAHYTHKQIEINDNYNHEAKILWDSLGNRFENVGAFYMALAELYQFGETPLFPDMHTPCDHAKAAHWLLWALKVSNKKAFLFLHSLVPECFVKEYDQKQMTQAICQVLDVLNPLYKDADTVTDCMKIQAIACFMADLVIHASWEIDSQIQHVLLVLEAIEKHVEPYIVTAFKSN